MAPSDRLRVPVESLERAVAGIFRTRGVPPDDAAQVARHLVFADARGIHSHGVIRLDFYLEKLDRGGMRPVTRLDVELDRGAFLRLSANNGIGHVAAARGMELAIERARERGMAAVLVRHSNHFGVAQFYTLMAARQGLIGLALTNTTPVMAPTGGAEKLIGNNPWSLAVPSTGEFPIVIDMASTVVARGKVLVARREGREIPEGWALDARGLPTTDPAAALAGTLVPVGGHKGYAAALGVELLTGVLGGAAWLTDVAYPERPEGPGKVTHLLAALDPEILSPPGYAARAEDVVRRVHGTRRAEGVDRVYLPGEIEHRREEESRRSGVPLSPELYELVERRAREAGVPLPG